MSKEKRHDRMKFIDENSSIATKEELIASRFYLMGYEYAQEKLKETKQIIEMLDNMVSKGEYYASDTKAIVTNTLKSL